MELSRDVQKFVTRDVTRVCGCGVVYTTTDRRKMFCGKRCGNAARQRRMRSEVRIEPKGTMVNLRAICAGKVKSQSTMALADKKRFVEWVDTEGCLVRKEI